MDTREVVCTICSREKRPEPMFLPAHERYLGEHVAQVRQFARERGMPFFVLSGRFGLMHEDDPVPHYDYMLTEHDIERLIPLIQGPLVGHGIRRILFYHKPKPSWMPYTTALIGACLREEVGYTDMPLKDAPAALHAV